MAKQGFVWTDEQLDHAVRDFDNDLADILDSLDHASPEMHYKVMITTIKQLCIAMAEVHRYAKRVADAHGDTVE